MIPSFLLSRSSRPIPGRLAERFSVSDIAVDMPTTFDETQVLTDLLLNNDTDTHETNVSGTLTYTLVSDTSNKHAVDPSNCGVSLIAGQAPLGAGETATLVVDVSDGTETKQATITLTGVEQFALSLPDVTRIIPETYDTTQVLFNINNATTGDDTHRGSAITYSLVSGDTADYQIDPNTGAGSFLGSVTQATPGDYTFVVRGTADGDTADATVSISVTATPVTSTVTLTDASAEILASASVGDLVIDLNEAITQVDASQGALLPLTYSITAGNGSGFFAVNASNGRVTVAASATAGDYTLTVEGDDGNASDTADIMISVLAVAPTVIENTQAAVHNANFPFDRARVLPVFNATENKLVVDLTRRVKTNHSPKKVCGINAAAGGMDTNAYYNANTMQFKGGDATMNLYRDLNPGFAWRMTGGNDSTIHYFKENAESAPGVYDKFYANRPIVTTFWGARRRLSFSYTDLANLVQRAGWHPPAIVVNLMGNDSTNWETTWASTPDSVLIAEADATADFYFNVYGDVPIVAKGGNELNRSKVDMPFAEYIRRLLLVIGRFQARFSNVVLETFGRDFNYSLAIPSMDEWSEQMTAFGNALTAAGVTWHKHGLFNYPDPPVRAGYREVRNGASALHDLYSAFWPVDNVSDMHELAVTLGHPNLLFCWTELGRRNPQVNTLGGEVRFKEMNTSYAMLSLTRARMTARNHQYIDDCYEHAPSANFWNDTNPRKNGTLANTALPENAPQATFMGRALYGMTPGDTVYESITHATDTINDFSRTDSYGEFNQDTTTGDYIARVVNMTPDPMPYHIECPQLANQTFQLWRKHVNDVNVSQAGTDTAYTASINNWTRHAGNSGNIVFDANGRSNQVDLFKGAFMCWKLVA